MCSTISAEVLAILQALQGLGSTNKSAISLLSSLTPPLSSPPYPLLHISFYLNLSGRSGNNCFSLLLFYQATMGSSNTRFFRETTWLISWPDRERYSCPLQSIVVSLLLSLVFILMFSRTGRVLSHLYSLTPKTLSVH